VLVLLKDENIEKYEDQERVMWGEPDLENRITAVAGTKHDERFDKLQLL
jgi:hypothetical protein